MNRFSLAAIRIAFSVLIVFAAARCRADGTPQRMENRFLFLIDTSSAMKSRTNGIEQAVAGLLETDMHGEFRKGDTIGIWSFNDEIHADFPMQVWSPENKVSITRDILRYLRHERYGKRSHLDKVLNTVGRIMAESDRLTMIFVYDGSEKIHGTLYDGDINELQKKYARQFHSDHLPMVTILAARFGQVFDYTINYPGSITVPHTAVELPQPELVVAPPTNAVPEAPPLPHRRIEIVMSGTNTASITDQPPDAATNKPARAPVNIVMTGPKQSPPQPATAAATPVVTAQIPIPSNSPPPEANPQSAPPQKSAPSAKPEPLPVVPQTAPQVQPITETPAAPQPSPVSPPVSTPPVVATTSSPTAPASNSAAAPAPATPPESAPPPDRQQSPVVTTAPAAASLPNAAPSNPAQQAALIVIALSLLTIAVVLVVFLVRRSRGAAPSLISQSMDRGH